MNRPILIALAAVLFLASCDNGTPNVPPDATVKPPGPDAATVCETRICGTTCCGTADEVCFNEACCKPTSCTGRECGDDGCGTSCGTCGTGATCNTTTWKCESCAPETDAEFCTRLGRVCGAATGTDNCNSPRSVASCGVCTNNKTCDEALGTCTGACVPESREAFCLRNGKDCGSFKANDNCEAERTENCGLCQANQDCLDNVCVGCVPETNDAFCTRMAGLGKVCGIVNDLDRCGTNKSVDCGLAACTTGQICTSENKCLDCTPETDAELCQAVKRECGGLAVTDKCGKARTVTSCGTCAAGKSCTNDGTCLNSTLPEDTCGGAKALTFTGDEAKVTGDANTATADYQSSCGAVVDGKDVVYSFTITSAKAVTATVNVTAGSMVPVVFVRSICTSGAVADEKACQKGTTSGGAQAFMPNLAAGTYYVIVDGNTTTGSEYTLTVTVAPPFVAPANDVCGTAGASAVPLVFTGDLSSAQGDTTAAANDYAGTCAGSAGGDVVYSFTLTAEKSVTATLTRDASSATYKPVVYLRSVCDSAVAADQKACAADITGTATAVAKSLPAGTYYVVVDGDGSYGKYDLQVQLADPIQVPVNDVCAGAKALTFTADKATEQGDTTNANDDTKGTCETTSKPMNGPDLVYSFTTATERSAAITVVADATSATFKPSVYVRSACDSIDAADQKGCALAPTTGATAVTIYKTVPNTTYYVFVDGESATAGKFTLEVTLGNAISNPDNCANVEALVFDANGLASVVGDNTIATNDISATTCGGSGPDQVFSYTLTAVKDVVATLAPTTGSTLDPVLSLRTTCDDSASQVICAEDEVAAFTIKSQQPGTYFLWVDGYASTKGGYTLTVATNDPLPVPGNDKCAAPEVLTVAANVATATGDTRGALEDYTGLCTSTSGGDVVYSLTTTAQQMVSAKVTADATTPAYKPVVYIRNNCTGTASADQAACAAATLPGGSATAVASDLAPGTYFIIVDGAGTDGKFNLEVTLSAPRPLPDACANAWAMTLDANGYAMVSGDTSLATDSGTGTCKASITAKDLVYSFTLAAEKTVTVTQTFSGTSDWPMLYVRKSCDSTAATDEVGCLAKSGGGAASITMKKLPAGTYYVWVDSSYNTDEGPFTLEVSAVDPAVAPANDTCAAPAPLTFTADVATASGDLGGAANDYSGGCNGTTGTTGGDAVYSFTLTAAQQVVAKVTPDASTPAFRPAVYVRSTCDDTATQQSCALASAAAQPATATAINLPPGTYFVVVDGVASDGKYNLEVTLSAPILLPDTCATAEVITLDAAGAATITGDNSLANDNSAGNCRTTMPSRDVVYSLTIPSRKNVTAKVTYPSGKWPALYLRKTCDQAATEVACAPGSTNITTLVANNLDAGTYFLWIDSGYTSEYGAYTLEITTADSSPAPSNDTCATTDPALTFDASGVAVAVGDTSGAANDYNGAACATASGGDVIYSFTLAAPAKIDAKVTPDAASTLFKPALYLRSACASGAATDELGCFAGTTAGGAATLTIFTVPAGTYYLVVDSNGSSFGAFNLEVTQSAPVGFPDTCASAEPLTLDPVTKTVTVTNDTTNANNSGTGSCKSTTANDLVYSLTVTAPTNLTAKMSFTGGGYLWPMVYIQSACGVASSEVACVSTSSSAPVTATAKNLPAGTYYIWVDASYNTDDGPFSLEVTAVDAPPAPANDNCAAITAPEAALTFDASGVATATGATGAAANDYTGTCGTMSGGDVVYTFTLTDPANVAVKVTPDAASTSFKPGVYIRTVCDSATATDQKLCVAGSTAGAAINGTAYNLAAGTYALIVDGVTATDGAFALEVTKLPASVLPDDCTTAADLVFVGDTATVTGDTAAGAQSGDGTCNSSSGPDLVYKMSLTSAASVRIVTTPNAGSGLRPNVYVRKACSSTLAADQVACVLGTTTGSPVTLAMANLAAGDYWIWVDGYSSSTKGPFTMTVTQAAPVVVPDDCTAPEALVFDASGIATASGDLTYATTTGNGTCLTGTGADVVYSFTTTQEKNVEVEVTPTAGSAHKPVVYVRKACTSTTAADSVACAYTSLANTAVKATVKRLPAGTYFVWVDSYSTSAIGAYTLKVTAVDPPPPPGNDVCAALTSGGPYDLTAALAGGTASIAGDTTNAIHDYTGTCNSTTGMTGGDAVYMFELTADSSVIAKVTPDATAADFKAAVYLQTLCGSTVAADEKACNKSTTALLATGFSVATLPPGTYYLVVDGLTATAGKFTLDVTVGAPMTAPANDACGAEIDLGDVTAGPVSVTGYLNLATDSGRGTCTSLTSGPDVVYKFNSGATPKAVQITMAATTLDLKPLVYVRTACADTTSTAQKGCQYSAVFGSSTTVTLTGLTASTEYFVFVDGYDNTKGGYKLDLVTMDPPTNDQCGIDGALAIPLTLNTLVTSSTSLGTADYGSALSPVCYGEMDNYNANGKDVVYSYAAAAGETFTVELTPSGWDAALWYSVGTCGDQTNCVHASDVGLSGVKESLTVTAATAATYFFVVDGYSSTGAGGGFTILVKP